MNDRDAILNNLRRNRPEVTPLPEVPSSPVPEGDLVEHFARMVRQVGGQLFAVPFDEVAARLQARYPDAAVVASAVPEHVPGTMALDAISDPHDLAHVDLYVCEGCLGVAENGATWIPESHLRHRAAPFLAQHLAIILHRDRLVWTLHDAYARLRVAEDAFGVFIAGPSKTADIEQSLVHGAHGPRSLTVVLLNEA